jgi:enterochelin esterase family protein
MPARLHAVTRAIAALLAASVAAPAVAQPPASPALAAVSPVVHPDRRVTLRLVAPAADSVRLVGDILDGAPPLALARDASGVWSVTVGPRTPDVYTYAFVVDGVTLPDPLNGHVKTGPGGMFGATSQVEVPGDGPQFHDARPVPHGLVSALQYESRALGVPRRALVYTPPGYEAGRETYPVLVLMHGIGDTEVDWVHTGRANQILDNLIAEGTVRPMVVVMPLGHARQSVGIGPVPNGRAGEPLRGDPFAHAAIERDLLDDLLPAVERRFRVARDADRRAIAGLSLGGTQGLRIGLRHLDRFGWIATLSAALVDADPAVVHAGVLADTAATHRRLRLLYVTVGRDDPLLAANQRFADALRRAGVRHTFRIEEGRHEWRLWRRNLRDVLPLLFRD